jgi:hypothetical protein
MDDRRFDDLTRALVRAAPLPRRRLLRSLVASLLAGGTTRLRETRSEAACPPGTLSCTKSGGAQVCVPACQVDQVLGAGCLCRCKTTGKPPGSGGCPCPAGQVKCDGQCTDLADDPANCGACGAECLPGPNVQTVGCKQGDCAIKACLPGFADCDGDPANGCETPLGTDTDCAACGDACDAAADEVCQNGLCVEVCTASGETCHSHGDCCSSWCDVTCTPLPCADVGEPCATDRDCCQRLCKFGVCAACIPDGEPCAPFSDCCSTGCTGGLCGIGFACYVTGGSCPGNDKWCCNFGEYCVGKCL